MWDPPDNLNLEKRQPPHHPGLSLVRVTEAAALAASRWMGRGDRLAADWAAQLAMAKTLNLLPMNGRIVLGEEGRTGETSTLDSGRPVGSGTGPEMDVEINAIDGATLVAEGKSGAISVAAIAPRGTMWTPGPAIYLNKLVVDRTVADSLGPETLDAPTGWILAAVARAKGMDISELAVFILDRPRHAKLISEVRQAGARVLLRKGGDVSGAMMAADPDVAIDLLLGIGGAAEGLMSACAVKALDGMIMARVAPQSESEAQSCREQGLDLNRILTRDDLITGNEVFFSATGVTVGWLLGGVSYRGQTVETHSVVLRCETGTRRLIHTKHRVK